MSKNIDLAEASRILGISDSSDELSVRKKYKELVKTWHPDVNNSKEAQEKMRMINHAFEQVMKNKFNVIDVWEDYDRWWFDTFKNDSLCGGGPPDENNIPDNDCNSITDKSTSSNPKSNMVDELLNKENVFAVVGVSKDPKKYGNKVYFDLKNAGYNVYPINPAADNIQGDKCYSSLDDVPEKPDVAVFVTPPSVSEKIVKEDMIELGITKAWFQPGSESKEIIDFCRFVRIKTLHGVCVMVERQKIK